MTGHRKWRMIRHKMPIREIVFGNTTIHARCWCDACGWEIFSTGWYDSDGSHVTLAMVVSAWQVAHDDEGPRVCLAEIRWEERGED